MDVTNQDDAKRVANARRQREYRARKRAAMGEKAYLESVAKYKRDLRVRKNRAQPEQAPINVEQQPDTQPITAPRSVEIQTDPQPRSISRSVAIQTEPQPIDIFRSVEIQTEPQPTDQQIIEPRRSLRSRKPPPKQVQAKNQPKTISKGDNCPAIIDMINKNAREEGREISDTTAKTQVNRVSTLYKAMTGNTFDCNDYSWVKDTDKVLKFIQDNPKWDSKDRKKQNTRNAHRTALASVLRDVEGYSKQQEIYSRAATDVFNKEISPSMGEGKLSTTQQKNYLPFEKLLNARSHYKPGTQGNALISIYTDTPPRRSLDYQVMKVIKKKNKSVTQKYVESLKNQKDFNFVILDNKNRPMEFIFNNFKTVRSIGSQVVPIPVELSKTLQRYIATAQINNGDLLFESSRGKPYSNFGELVKKTFKAATGKNITVNLIRHAYITYYLGRKRTVNERKRLAKLMGHDVNTQSLYEVIDKDD